MLLWSCDAKTVDKSNSGLGRILVKVIIQIMCSDALQPLNSSEAILNNLRRIIFLSFASQTLSSSGGEIASSNEFAVKRP